MTLSYLVEQLRLAHDVGDRGLTEHYLQELEAYLVAHADDPEPVTERRAS